MGNRRLPELPSLLMALIRCLQTLSLHIANCTPPTAHGLTYARYDFILAYLNFLTYIMAMHPVYGVPVANDWCQISWSQLPLLTLSVALTFYHAELYHAELCQVNPG